MKRRAPKTNVRGSLFLSSRCSSKTFISSMKDVLIGTWIVIMTPVQLIMMAYVGYQTVISTSRNSGNWRNKSPSLWRGNRWLVLSKNTPKSFTTSKQAQFSARTVIQLNQASSITICDNSFWQFHRHRSVVLRVRTARQFAWKRAVQSPQVNHF